MIDYDPVGSGLEPRRPLLSRLLLPGIAFVLGLAAMGWLLAQWNSAAMFLGITPEPAPVEAQPAPQPAPAPAQPPQPQPQLQAAPLPGGELQRFVIDPETQRRVAQLEQRFAEISTQSRSAVGNADRAEGLLVAFAARRALERGVALGYIEHLLRERFGATQPQAVGTIITVARQPVTLQELQRELQDAGPRLTGAGPDQGWWAALKSELSGLITIRREGTQSTVPSDRLERALRHVQAGEVNLALVEVMRMPGSGQAQAWIEKARRYVAARAALDTIEIAALLDPANRPQPAPAAAPPQAQRQPPPARPAPPTRQPPPRPRR
ncbi:hypothetical protein [Allosphingosinicella sp.]|jgi:hypothetical protein|uniref:hypothetical protein n=1 Tax=Allosphingosinicella sp. TaxID=2823234 RepID=UPI002EF60700